MTYLTAITSLDSHEHLTRLKELDWPNLKDAERSKHWKRMQRLAYPKTYNGQSSRRVTTKELFEILRGG